MHSMQSFTYVLQYSAIFDSNLVATALEQVPQLQWHCQVSTMQPLNCFEDGVAQHAMCISRQHWLATL